MSFIPVSKIISAKFSKSPVAMKVTAALVCGEFDKLILELWGKKIENTAQAMYLKDKVLTVACLSSVAAAEIKMREMELIEKINQKFGEGQVIRLRLLT